MSKSKIEWTERTWSPMTGCTKVSEGCRNCYAEREVETRWSKNPKSVFFGRKFSDVRCHPDQLEKPLSWRKSQIVFVCPRADLFHESVPFEFIDQIFAVMALANQHTFQVLTKRPKRMLEWFSRTEFEDHNNGMREEIARWKGVIESGREGVLEPAWEGTILSAKSIPWPLPSIWLGVTVENQQAADERIPLLLQCPAAVRWISVEPMVGAIDLRTIDIDGHRQIFPLSGTTDCEDSNGNPVSDIPRIDWVVCGGESGKNARPMHPDWARSLRDQCTAADVPFMFKQWGEFGFEPYPLNGMKPYESVTLGEHILFKCGKTRSSRLLDGVLHDEYPIGNQ